MDADTHDDNAGRALSAATTRNPSNDAVGRTPSAASAPNPANPGTTSASSGHDRSAWHGCGCCTPHPRATRSASATNPLQAATRPAGEPLRLSQFKPRSALRTRITRINQPRFPVIDAHTHLGWMAQTRSGVSLGEDMIYFADPAPLVELMDRKGIRAMVNLTGGVGAGLAQSIARFNKAAPGRFLTMTEPSFHLFGEADYPQRQVDALADAKHLGACGLKLLKTLGLYLREHIDEGPLVAVDDPRFDPMWKACAELGMPVFVHTADPLAFFQPTDGHNERYEELAQHPDWSFYGADFPSHADLIAARDRVIARHPNTTFVLLHVGNQGEDMDALDACMARFPNTLTDISARIGELGRQPRRSRRFIEKYQDRVLFGTDAVPPPFGNDVPQQLLCDELYDIYYRFLETDDEYFDYAPADVPPQGRWSIYGLNLPEPVLRKVYHDNAARLLGLDLHYSPASYCAGPMSHPERVSLGRSAHRSETTSARSSVVKPAQATPLNRLATNADE